MSRNSWLVYIVHTGNLMNMWMDKLRPALKIVCLLSPDQPIKIVPTHFIGFHEEDFLCSLLQLINFY